MTTFKLTHDDAQEVSHKMCILADEPELQESYGLTQEQATALLRSVPHVRGGDWLVPDFALAAVRGEMENHVDVLRACSAGARDGGEIGQALRIAKQAAKFERMFVEGAQS